MSTAWMSAGWPVGGRLGLERAGHTLLAVAGRGAAIWRAAAVTVPPSPDGTMPIDSALAHVRGSVRSVHVVLCDPEHIHRTLVLPPMTRGEYAEVVRREVARDGETERVWAWRPVRQVVVDEILKQELLIVSAARSRFEEALDPLVRQRLEIDAVLTGPVALMSAARALSPEPLQRPVALAHWGPSILLIAIVSGGVLRFSRIIEPPVTDLDPRDWLPVEVDRSIRHYAILSKGERVERVMISVARHAAAERLFAGAALTEQLRVPVSNLNALMGLRLPPRSWGELGEGAFVLAYGAVLSRRGEIPNLLPRPLVVSRRSRRVVAGAMAAGLMAVGVIGSEFALANREVRTARARLAAMRAARHAYEGRMGQAGLVESERTRARELARLVDAQPVKQLPAGDALRAIAQLAPDRVRLDRVTMTLDAQGYAFTLVGGVDRPDLTDAQRDLNAFYFGLRDSPLFYDVQLQLDAASASAAGPSAAPPSVVAPGAGEPANVPVAHVLPFVIVLRGRALM